MGRCERIKESVQRSIHRKAFDAVMRCPSLSRVNWVTDKAWVMNPSSCWAFPQMLNASKIHQDCILLIPACTSLTLSLPLWHGMFMLHKYLFAFLRRKTDINSGNATESIEDTWWPRHELEEQHEARPCGLNNATKLWLRCSTAYSEGCW